MFFESTMANIHYLIDNVFVVSKEQLDVFFLDTVDSENVEFYTNQLIDQKFLTLQSNRNFLIKKDFAKEKTEYNRTYIKTTSVYPISSSFFDDIVKIFWCVAYCKSSQIKDVFTFSIDPAQIMFVTTDGDLYDVTMCSSLTKAHYASIKRKAFQVPGVEDDVCHIALVNNEETGMQMKDYGFDLYCILQENNEPEYFQT